MLSRQSRAARYLGGESPAPHTLIDEAAVIERSGRHGAGKTSKRVGTARNPGQRAKFAKMNLRDVVDQRKVDAEVVDMP